MNFKNHLLIAMPTLQGEFFAKSVVFIYEHSEKNGTLGFTINKPLSATLGNVMNHLTITIKDGSIVDLPVFSGGPLGPDQGFVIHDRMHSAESEKDTDIMISTSREILTDIAEGNGPNHYVVTLGYAGWEPGQLESEIQRNDWLVAPLQKQFIFNTPISQRWSLAAKSIGIDLSRLSTQTGHA